MDVLATLAVGAATLLMVRESEVYLDRPPNECAYLLGVLMTLPVVAWRRRPLTAMLLSTAVLLVYYQWGFGISPITVLALPLYAAAVAGRAAWAAGLVVALFSAGYVSVGLLEEFRPLGTLALFSTHAALGAAVVLLGEAVRARRALSAQTRERLRLERLEREREAARKVAEERVRIARELHDTVAHSMTAITVQAAGALHVLDEASGDARPALTAIRGASKEALRDFRSTLGMLRDPVPSPGLRADGARTAAHGLDRLPTLLDAVRAAGVPVELEEAGRARPLAPPVDHAAYRIVQEALTNVLRHAGGGARATVRLAYDPDGLTVEVADDGAGPRPAQGAPGHGLTGMRERALATGGTFAAGPRPDGGFAVEARLREAAG